MKILLQEFIKNIESLCSLKFTLKYFILPIQ